MEISRELFVILISFAVLALAAGQIGRFFSRFQLPLISGFLFAGMLVGPFGLDLISSAAIEQLRFVDEVSLAFIAFAAGSELHLQNLKSRLRSISWVTLGNAIALPLFGVAAIFLLSGMIPFTRQMGTNERAAVALLAGAILLARSPSSAIAIVSELRAKGPFTQTVLGVTMVTDVVVILVFAINAELADALLSGLAFNVGFVALLMGELLLSLAIGYLLGKALQGVLSLHTGQYVKSALVLLLGFGVFALSTAVRTYSRENLPVEVLLEPLLIAMVGSFVVTNFSAYRSDFLHLLEDLAPNVYTIFFTLTGASLALDLLADTLLVALLLFVVRLAGIFIGSFAGGVMARDPMRHNRISWMAYITQAGVGLGLAKEVAVEFPVWGDAFATTLISVIILSQILGPPFFKWAINHVGEAHTRAPTPTFDGVRDAVIFGGEGQSLALARQLQANGWEVKIACLEDSYLREFVSEHDALAVLPDISLESLTALDLNKADALVAMMADDVNYAICELAYEHFGTQTMVVRLNDRANLARFHALGAFIIEPSTAMVSLLEHSVRSPAGASLLLGMDGEQDIADIEVRDQALAGLPLRDLRLPLDSLVLSVSRDGHTIISHGYTQLRLGDHVTVLGTRKSLAEVMRRFSA